ncbi:MAG: hypothetical protein ACRDMY_07755 [Gaiellaceae bacterium]
MSSWRRKERLLTDATVGSNDTRLFPPELDRRYPVVVRGEGVWLEDAAGRRYLDAMSGGSMAATLGYAATTSSSRPSPRRSKRSGSSSLPYTRKPGRACSSSSSPRRTAFARQTTPPYAKLAVKGVADSLGLRASFLAKTVAGEEGSSGHLHLSCWQDGANAFAAEPGGDLPPACTAAVATTDGMRRRAEPPEPVVGDAYARDELPALPGSLESALAAFRADEVLRAGLGKQFSDYYTTSREWELQAWRETVSDWERERYERAV